MCQLKKLFEMSTHNHLIIVHVVCFKDETPVLLPPARPMRRRALWPDESSAGKRRNADEPNAPAEPQVSGHGQHNVSAEVS